MKKENLIQAFEELRLDPQRKKEIEERLENTAPQAAKNRWKPAFGAAMLLLALVLFTQLPRENPLPSPAPLKKITYALFSEGAGYSGILLRDPQELQLSSFWPLDQLPATLPVYENPLRVLFQTPRVAPQELFTEEKRSALLASLGQRLGQELIPELSHFNFNGGSLYLTDYLETSVTLDYPYPFQNDPMTPESFAAALVEFGKAFPNLFPFSEIGTEVFRSYSFEGDPHLYGWIYDASGSPEEDAWKSSAEHVYTSFHEDNTVVFWLPYLSPPVLLGNYPILTLDEARQELLHGNYLTTVPYDEVLEAEEIIGAELVYETSDFLIYHQPVYKFYVELDEEVEYPGMKTYGIYLVPAVSRDYLEIIPSEIYFN